VPISQNFQIFYPSDSESDPNALVLGLVISWTAPTANFILQQSSDLANWSSVTNAPILNITNLQDQVILPISQSQSFYRLKTL